MSPGWRKPSDHAAVATAFSRTDSDEKSDHVCVLRLRWSDGI